MEFIEEIEAYIINAKRYMALIIFILIFGTSITIIVGKISQIFILIGIFTFWIGPFLIQKRLKKPFLRKMHLDFAFDKILLKTFDKDGENLEDQLEIYYHQIKSFKTIDSDRDDTSFLKIIIKDGRVIKYSFVGQSNDVKRTDVTQVVKKYILQFNKKQLSKDKIELIPSLFSTREGTVYIGILTFLLVLVVIWQIIYKPGSIPFSMFAGIALTLQIIVQRKKDLKTLKDFNNENL
jgi:hypothetical protein